MPSVSSKFSLEPQSGMKSGPVSEELGVERAPSKSRDSSVPKHRGDLLKEAMWVGYVIVQMSLSVLLPQQGLILFSLSSLLALLWRAWTYFQKKQEFLLLEYCYPINILLLLVLNLLLFDPALLEATTACVPTSQGCANRSGQSFITYFTSSPGFIFEDQKLKEVSSSLSDLLNLSFEFPAPNDFETFGGGWLERAEGRNLFFFFAFGIVFGPLPCYSVWYRNALDPSSSSKMCSFLFHLMPAVVLEGALWNLRVFSLPSFLPLRAVFLFPWAFACLLRLVLDLLTYLNEPPEEYLTCYRLTMRSMGSAFPCNLILEMQGEGKRRVCYFFLYVLQSFVFHIPSLFCLYTPFRLLWVFFVFLKAVQEGWRLRKERKVVF